MRRQRFTTSGSSSIVVVQHAAQALAPLYRACVYKMARLWADHSVGQALMIALRVVMGDEVVNGRPQRLLSKQDHPLQTGFLDGSHEPLGVGIQIRRSRR